MPKKGKKYSSVKECKRDTMEQVMHEWKKGKLHMGRSGKKVTSYNQAVAIGISESNKYCGKAKTKAVKRPRKKTTKGPKSKK